MQSRKRQGNQREGYHEVARMEREMTTLKSPTKEKTHGNYRTSTSYQTGSDEKGSTSDSSLYSEDRVLQLENEKERDSGD